MSLIKPFSFDWLIIAFDSLKNQIIFKSFQLVGISDIYYMDGQYSLFPSNINLTIQLIPSSNLLTLAFQILIIILES